MRQQFKEGADFIKIYETGPDAVKDGKFFHGLSIYGSGTGRGGAGSSTSWESRGGACDRGTGNVVCGAGGSGIDDHANQLSDETMRLMREKQIFAVPTFTIFEYFAEHGETPAQAARERGMLDFKNTGISQADRGGRSDGRGIGRWPFPHGRRRGSWF